jgi:hypothetical protein
MRIRFAISTPKGGNLQTRAGNRRAARDAPDRARLS